MKDPPAVPYAAFSWLGRRSGGGARHPQVAVWLDRALVLVAVMVCVAIFLQAGVIVHNKSSENVSMPSYILLVLAALVWMFYGMVWNDGLVALSGLVCSAGAIFALVASVSYRPGTTPGAFSTL